MLISNNTAPQPDDALPDWLKLVKQQVAALQFGVVQIVMHNAKVVQIEKTEKVRLEH